MHVYHRRVVLWLRSRSNWQRFTQTKKGNLFLVCLSMSANQTIDLSVTTKTPKYPEEQEERERGKVTDEFGVNRV